MINIRNDSTGRSKSIISIIDKILIRFCFECLIIVDF